jgi:hypothetical protein
VTKWVPFLVLLACAHASPQVASVVPIPAGTVASWGKPVRIQFSSAPAQMLLVFDDAGHLAISDQHGGVQPVPFGDALVEADVVLGGAAPRLCALLRSARLECVEPTRRLGWTDLPNSTGVYAAGVGLCFRTATGPICFALQTDGVRTSLVPAAITPPPQPPCTVHGGEAMCTGSSRHGELGDGDVIEGQRTARVGLTHVLQAAIGRRHGCAVQMNRHVFCWGVVSDGPELFPTPPDVTTEQLPICELDPATNQFDHRNPCDEPKEAPLPYVVRPVPLELTGVVSLAISGERTCMLLESGEIRCFGKTD